MKKKRKPLDISKQNIVSTVRKRGQFVKRTRLALNYLTVAGTLIDDLSYISTWILLGTPLPVESSTFFTFGTKSIFVDTEATVGQRSITKNGLSINTELEGGMFFIFYNTYKKSTVNIGITLYLSTLDNISGDRWQINSPKEHPPGWNTLYIPNDDWSVSLGTPDWSQTFTSFRWRLDGVDGAPKAQYVDAMYVGRRSRPKVVITFDDGWSTTKSNAFPIAQAKNIPLTHYIIPSTLGSGDFITEADVITMQSAGDYIGAHDGVLWDNEATSLGLINTAKAEIQAITGVEPRHAAWPQGRYGEILGTDGSIITQALTTLDTCRATTPDFCFYPAMAYNPGALPTFALNNTKSIAELKSAVDLAIKTGGTVTFYGHKVDTVEDSLTITTANFTELLTYIALKRDQGLIDAVNIDEWYKGL